MTQTLLYAKDAQASAEVLSVGGRILHTFNGAALVVELPDNVAAKSLRHCRLDPPAKLNPAVRLAVKAWARNQDERTKARSPKHTEGLRWDTPGYKPPRFEPTRFGPTKRSIRAAGLTLGMNQLRGTVAVGIVTVSGFGKLALSADENTKILQELTEGLEFLRAAKPSAGLQFKQDIHMVTDDAQPCANPDSCGSDYEVCEAPWRDRALKRLGYPPGLSGVRQYVDSIKKSLSADWAFVVFVTKYPLCHFAYASLGGPRICMNYDNDGWGVDNLHRVFAHEVGHIFGALDEYGQSQCTCGQVAGELRVPSNNCANCKDVPHLACLMDSNTEQVCDFSAWAMGWSNRLLTAAEMIGPSGGTGGDPFEEAPLPENAQITKIRVRSGTRLDAIGISYSLNGTDVDLPLHGGTGGSYAEFVLQDGEFVTGISGRFGARVDSIIIHTNLRSSIPYGGNGGSSYFNYSIPPNMAFAGFSGRAESEVDAIGLGLKLTAGQPSAQFMAMGPSGGTGGTVFGDAPMPAGSRIVKVRVRHGSRIDAIGISYSVDGVIIDGPMHGGGGGDLSEFSIADGDYLIGVSGRYGGELDSLILQTANGAYSERYGGSGGNANFSYILSPDLEIVGFNGRSGSRIDALGPIFRYHGPSPIARYKAKGGGSASSKASPSKSRRQGTRRS